MRTLIVQVHDVIRGGAGQHYIIIPQNKIGNK